MFANDIHRSGRPDRRQAANATLRRPESSHESSCRSHTAQLKPHSFRHSSRIRFGSKRRACCRAVISQSHCRLPANPATSTPLTFARTPPKVITLVLFFGRAQTGEGMLWNDSDRFKWTSGIQRRKFWSPEEQINNSKINVMSFLGNKPHAPN